METFPTLRDLQNLHSFEKLKVLIKDLHSPSPQPMQSTSRTAFVHAKSRKVVLFGITCQKHLIEGVDF